jgi:hypothetical protein
MLTYSCIKPRLQYYKDFTTRAVKMKLKVISFIITINIEILCSDDEEISN